MKPIEFPEQNILLKKPEGWDDKQCSSMPTFVQEVPELKTKLWISCWYLTPEERKQILESGKIWVHVTSEVHPPILLDLNYPFTTEKES